MHLSTMDAVGGAFRGTAALHRELLRQGVDSWMLVGRRLGDAPQVVGPAGPRGRVPNALRYRLEQLPLRRYRMRGPGTFSPAWLPGSSPRRARALRPDIVHLHWVSAGFVGIGDLARFGVPIVWTVRDMWPFTGGCHYSGGCERFRASCGACPVLGSSRERDLSRRVWERKRAAWQGVPITPVAISNWVAEQAAASPLPGFADVRVIHNAVDMDVWKPADRSAARRALGVPRDRRVVLFVALNVGDPRKGFAPFLEACRLLAGDAREPYHLLIAGESAAAAPVPAHLPATHMGLVADDARLRLAYAAADVTVVPSLEEAFGKTAAESLACGTPVVTWDATGLRDVVDHEETGYRAVLGDAGDLAAGVRWVLADDERWARLSAAGRAAAEQRFAMGLQARRYAELYDEIHRGGHGG